MVASVVSSARTPSNGTDATGASLALTIPAGTAIDDYAAIIVELWDSSATNPTLTYPSGFTQIVNYVSTTDGFQKLKVALKKLTAADSGTYSVSGFGSHFRQGHVVILRGIDLTTALDVAVNLAQNSTGTALPSNSITTVTNGALLLWAICNENTCTQNVNPTGYTKQLDSNYLKTNTKVQATAGTDTPSGGSFSASTLKLGALIAFRAATSGSNVTGTAVAALGAPTATAAGKRTLFGTAAKAFTGPTATASGLRTDHGSGSALLPTVAGTAVGLKTVVGVAAATLAAVVAVAAGLRHVSGSGSSGLAPITAAAAGARTTAGAGNSALPAPAATATALREGHGSGAAGLPGIFAAAVGAVEGTPTALAQLPQITATAAGQKTVFGFAAKAFAGPTAGASALRGGHGSGVAALPSPDPIAAGQRETSATATAQIGQLIALAEGGSDGVEPPEIEPGWLTLGDLMDARATHESIMLDVIGVRHPGRTEEPYDEDLGYAPSTPLPEYYHGKATVQARQISSGQNNPAGLGRLTELGYAVHGPVGSAIDNAAPDDIITVYESADPRHDGLVLVVRNVESSSFVTARRIVCTLYEPPVQS